jgi:uncharacterized protein
MRVAIYGGTGSIGSQVVAEAVRRGHQVTTLARNERPVADGATFAIGDAADPDTTRRIAETHDVVVSALGPTRDPNGDPDTFADVIAAIAGSVGSTRLIVVGGAGSLQAAPGLRLVDTPEVPAGVQAGGARVGAGIRGAPRCRSEPGLDILVTRT